MHHLKKLLFAGSVLMISAASQARPREANTPIATLIMKGVYFIQYMAFTPDGKRFAAIGQSETPDYHGVYKSEEIMWNINNEKIIHCRERYFSHGVTPFIRMTKAVYFTPDEPDKAYNTVNGAEIPNFPNLTDFTKPTDEFYPGETSRDGNYVIAENVDETRWLSLIKPDTQGLVQIEKRLELDPKIERPFFSLDSKYLFYFDYDNNLSVVDVPNAKHILQVENVDRSTDKTGDGAGSAYWSVVFLPQSSDHDPLLATSILLADDDTPSGAIINIWQLPRSPK